MSVTVLYVSWTASDL